MKTVKVHGIYKILNKINQKFYIGSAKNLANRFATHKKDLRKNQHHNTHLQAAWNKYGPDAFVFIVLETVLNVNDLFDREQWYLDTYKPYVKGIGYNKSSSARTSLGVRPSLETRIKQSKAAKQRFKQTPALSGEESPSSKLTWKIVNDIRTKYKTGLYTQDMLAKKYNLNRRYIGNLLMQKNWKDGTKPFKGLRRIIYPWFSTMKGYKR